jgi:hypothetical protein
MVMASPYEIPSPRNVFSLSAGFDVFIQATEFLQTAAGAIG